GYQRLERRRAEGDRLAIGIDEDVLPPWFLRRGDARRVVARDRGDVTRRRALPEGRAVRTVRRPERRADLGERAPALHLFVGQEEILRTRLRPHPLALGLRALDTLEAHLGREVHDAGAAPGEARDAHGAVERP